MKEEEREMERGKRFKRGERAMARSRGKEGKGREGEVETDEGKTEVEVMM